jgi:hypothetical protein
MEEPNERFDKEPLDIRESPVSKLLIEGARWSEKEPDPALEWRP